MSTSAAIASAASNRSFRACGSCQAPVEFDPTSGELKCAFCGARRAIARGRVPHHLLVEMAGLSVPAGSELRTLKCTHCGAQSSVAANVAATQCAFCAAPLANAGNAASPPAEGVIPFALVGIAVALGIVLSLVGWRRSRVTRYRLNRFAQANGMAYLARIADPPLPGMIFGMGRSRASSDVVRGTRPRFAEFGNYQYTTGSGKNSTTHHWGYVAVKLDVPFQGYFDSGIGATMQITRAVA